MDRPIVIALGGNALLRRGQELNAENQRDNIREAFFGGKTYAELAETQDVPLGTMKSWIRRGLAKLKTCLEAGE